jgi:hypothetical protein
MFSHRVLSIRHQICRNRQCSKMTPSSKKFEMSKNFSMENIFFRRRIELYRSRCPKLKEFSAQCRETHKTINRETAVSWLAGGCLKGPAPTKRRPKSKISFGKKFSDFRLKSMGNSIKKGLKVLLHVLDPNWVGHEWSPNAFRRMSPVLREGVWPMSRTHSQLIVDQMGLACVLAGKNGLI